MEKTWEYKNFSKKYLKTFIKHLESRFFSHKKQKMEKNLIKQVFNINLQ